MEWATYVDEALKTSPDEVPDLSLAEFRLLHASSGLSDEVREYQGARTPDGRREEASDICWYMALAWHALTEAADFGSTVMSEPRRWPTSSEIDDDLGAAAQFSGAVESVVCQRAPISDYKMRMARCLGEIAAMLVRDPDIGLSDVWRRNVDKLRARHGTTFSPAADQER